MAILLLANVGTRDVQLNDISEIPAELINPKKDGLHPRKAGEFLRQPENFKRFKNQLRLPMIEKALRYIAPNSWANVIIILFGTDQHEHVAAYYRDGDTIHFAELIKDILFERHKTSGLTKKQIQVIRTRDNPADYDLMYDFFRQQLPMIAEKARDGNLVYFLIAGGTPQMNTMLLFVGSEIFGAQAMPLYVSQDHDRASVLDITQQLYRRALQRSLQVMLRAYAYDPALKVLDENASYLDSLVVSLLRSTLNYATARRNLDLEAALRAFDPVLRETRTLRGTVASLQKEVEDQDEKTKLRETIYLAQLAEQTGNWADFLSRLHRFSEGTMQLMAESLAVKWSDKKTRSSYAVSWWNTNRAMLASLKLADTETPANQETENEARKVDRNNLRMILEEILPHDSSQRHALGKLAILDKAIPLRNDIVHRFHPISRDEIERRASAPISEMLLAMRQAYRDAFNAEVSDESPYDTINRLCHDILQEKK